MNKTMPMFYEDIHDALAKTVNCNPQGLSIKQVASADHLPVRGGVEVN